MISKTHLLLLIILGLVALSGCKGPKIKGLVPVRGIVTYNGEPLEGAAVCFTPKEFQTGDRLATGKTDANGAFELRTIGELGILPGEYVVVLIKNEAIPSKQPPRAGRPAPQTIKSLLPKRYGDPKTTDLNVAVENNGIRDLRLDIAD